MIGYDRLGTNGRFGNQLFQYAALRGIASKTGTNFMIPDHREIFDDGIGNKYTILLFDVFNLNPFEKKSEAVSTAVALFPLG